MTSRSLQERIQRLEDLEEIRRVIAELARGADRRNDPAVTRALFTEEAVWESPQFGRYEGLESIVEATTWGGREVILWSLHYMIAPIIEIDDSGRQAHAHWYLWEPMKFRPPGGQAADTWFGATYEARLRKLQGRWKIEHLLLDAKLLARVTEPWPGAIAAPAVAAEEVGRPRPQPGG